ncbi:probable ATP-dependent RNA helicase DDX20 [Brienomyrus brachyistius]|uniref:probable ATP-dependent RNA helicase DDX20 n=1 Tax=Brienomyrus brachyistius TaxID=42636 RepID=UPI0020B23EC7|nr:probable ATP-dependent RNA helicase DDX20 [Brienomyrus brachyistius]
MAASLKKVAHDIESRKRTDDVLLSEGIDFGSLLLSQPVLNGLTAAGFQKPSPIQLKSIPLGRCGLDLIVQAKSGTGKTCVFATISLDSLIIQNLATQVLVLAPTREIAVQIHSVITMIGSCMEGLECHVFIGGTPVSQDKARLKRCHIAIGSPGRVKQLIELGFLSTSAIRLFVLDEADKLLEEGSFQDQINWIYSTLPASKQMLALSATYPESLAQNLARYMRDPTFVRLNPTDPSLMGLKQFYKLVRSHPLPHKIFEEKVQHLFDLFSKIPFNQALVFSNLHSRAQHLADILSQKGLPATCISGSLSQDQRLEAMAKLRQYQCRVLISTDLTSRGIDAEKVNLVINLDVPQDHQTYMHRIGRAGRFGTYGLAVTYCCHGEEENKLMAIAHKSNLSLSSLPDPIPSGLMEEPCDWDVTVENLKMGPAFESFARSEKKKRAMKREVPLLAPSQLEDSGAEQCPEKTAASRPVKKSDLAVTTKISKQPKRTTNACEASISEAVRSETKPPDVPQIPSLSSFKVKACSAMSFDQAVADYESFITDGPGRSVEVVYQYTGNSVAERLQSRAPTAEVNSRRLAGDQSVERDSSPLSPGSTSSVSAASMEGTSESSSDSEEDRSEDRNIMSSPETDDGSVCGSKASAKRLPVDQLQKLDASIEQPTSLPKAYLEDESEEKHWRPRNSNARPCEIKDRKMEKYATEEACDDAKDSEDYRQAYHQARQEYRAAGVPRYPQGSGAAYSWMAAYRMNAIYMQELLKQ